MACSLSTIDPGKCDVTPMFYRALSVKQPFASLIGAGAKTIETRSYLTKYRGRLLICASAKVHNGNFLVLENDQLFDDNCQQFVKQNKSEYPLGVMICTVNLVDCRPMIQEDCARAWCKWYSGAYSWILEDVQPVLQIPVKGQLGIFKIESNLIQSQNGKRLKF